MALKLRPWTKLALEIAQDEHGFILQPVIRVGDRGKPNGKARRCKNEEQLWIEIERLAQDRLARLGLEKIKP